jgi:hypothetical protein
MNTTWVIWSATCLLASAAVPASESLLAVVRSCAAQADDSARLQCYDRGVVRFTGADNVAGSDTGCSDTGFSKPPGSAKSLGATQVAAAQNAPNTDQFGLTSGQVLRKDSKGERSPARKQLTARIVTLSHQPGGALVVHLDNGQVWEQTEDGPDLKLAAGDPVTIDRGLLGAYWLSPHSRHLAIKVRRSQ